MRPTAALECNQCLDNGQSAKRSCCRTSVPIYNTFYTVKSGLNSEAEHFAVASSDFFAQKGCCTSIMSCSYIPDFQWMFNEWYSEAWAMDSTLYNRAFVQLLAN